ncbi:hypothetical protein EB093_00150 [bacterium]|nr:hypothetical protein [bacterium]
MTPTTGVVRAVVEDGMRTYNSAIRQKALTPTDIPNDTTGDSRCTECRQIHIASPSKCSIMERFLAVLIGTQCAA